MSRLAAVDCGTNSLRLLIAEVSGGGQAQKLTDVDRRLEVVRLGQGVDQTGRFDPEALSRTLAVATDYAARCRDAGVEALRFAATSATRDAADRDVFIEAIRELFGTAPEVITGQEEAELSFVGACRGLTGLASDDEVVVVDIGGGSTEFVLGRPQQGVSASISIDMGCVRLYERHLMGVDDDHRHDALAAARRDVRAGLERAAAAVPWHRAAALIGVAGTVTTVTAHALGLASYDSDQIHGSELDRSVAEHAATDLMTMDRDLRAGLPYMHPGRTDVIETGALIWSEIMQRIGGDAGITTVRTSEHDILDGLVWSLSSR